MDQLKNLQPLTPNEIKVDTLLGSPCDFVHLNEPVGLDNLIYDKNLYRPQLALSGYVGLFTYKRIQIFGNTEMYYLEDMTLEERIKSFNVICKFPIPCIIITNNNKIDKELLDIATNNNIAVFRTAYDTTKTSYLLSEYLDDQFALQVVLHGSLVDVYGVGILFVGRSGIGKSEIALDLIERGHRLVADDIVMLTKKRGSILMGTGTSLVQHFMEFRGLGMIDIRQIFGIRSIRFQKRLEILVELEDYTSASDYTRTGLEADSINILGIDLETIKLPIFPGKNITVIAEVIALNYLLRTYGYNSANVFSDRLSETIRQKSTMGRGFHDQRIINYFQGDRE